MPIKILEAHLLKFYADVVCCILVLWFCQTRFSWSVERSWIVYLILLFMFLYSKSYFPLCHLLSKGAYGIPSLVYAQMSHKCL